MGIGMYGTTYLVPLFLGQTRGFSALQIGQTVLVVGLVQLFISPFNVYIAPDAETPTGTRRRLGQSLEKPWLSGAELKVRIQLPPARSQLRT